MLLGSKLLRKVWSQSNFFPHANTRNIVNCCVRLKAPAESKFSEESFWHKTHCLSRFWHNFVLWAFPFFFLLFFYSSALSAFDIKIKIECKGDQYIILWKIEITKSWVGATMMGDENAFTPTLCTALVSRDRWSKHAYQIPNERRPNGDWSNCILSIPFILSGSPSECRLYTCDACTILITTWTLRLRAPLVARSKVVKNIEIKIHIYAKRQKWICTTWPSFSLNCR